MRLIHALGRVVDVPEDQVEAYLSLGWEHDDAGTEETHEPSKSWKNAELKAYAEEHGIDLDGASTKAEMLAAIEASQTPAADEPAAVVETHEPTIAE